MTVKEYLVKTFDIEEKILKNIESMGLFVYFQFEIQGDTKLGFAYLNEGHDIFDEEDIRITYFAAIGHDDLPIYLGFVEEKYIQTFGDDYDNFYARWNESLSTFCENLIRNRTERQPRPQELADLWNGAVDEWLWVCGDCLSDVAQEVVKDFNKDSPRFIWDGIKNNFELKIRNDESDYSNLLEHVALEMDNQRSLHADLITTGEEVISYIDNLPY